MKTWDYISRTMPTYPNLYPTAGDRLLYVVGVIAFRLQKRKTVSKRGPLPEPDYVRDSDEWPPTIGR